MKKLGKYKVEPMPFSVGGMGEVYSAYDKDLSRYVCIKKIKEEYSNQEKFIRRFKREAKLMAKVDHPNVVRIFDFGANGSIWIAMELIKGLPISNRIGDFEISKSIKLFTCMSKALVELSKHNIAHCDIKPDNIIESEGRFVLIDFGLGFRDGGGDDDLKRTSIRESGGTPAYAPPEQTIGDPSIESDVYSLGVTIFEIITGKLPYDFKDRVKLANAHSNHAIPHISEHKKVPDWLNDLVMQCLSKNKADRPNPSQILSRLERTRHTLPTKKTIHISGNCKLAYDIISKLILRYEISDEADINITSDVNSITNLYSKNIYIIDVDSDDSEIVKASHLECETLIGPITIEELIFAIEK